MVEISKKGHPLESVTPTLESRIKRARELTDRIAEMRLRPKGSKNGSSVDPFAIAEEVGIYRLLDVTREQVVDTEQKKPDQEAKVQSKPRKVSRV